MNDRSLDPWRFICANSTSVTKCKSDKALFSPRCTPRVFDFIGGAWDTNQKNVVVNVVSTVAENSRGISAPVSSINSNSDWSSQNSICQIIATFNRIDFINFKISSMNLAELILGNIWIVTCLCDTMVSNICQTLCIESSIAS